MSSPDLISKENPVYMYKILRSDSKNAAKQSYKAFILVRAWPSANVDTTSDDLYFDYYYNDHIYRKQKVHAKEMEPYITAHNFVVWMRERNDALALELCKIWMTQKFAKTKKDIRAQAMKLMMNQEFASTLRITECDGYFGPKTKKALQEALCGEDKDE